MDFRKGICLLYIRPLFVYLGKFVDISYVNHFGTIMVYEFESCIFQNLSISTLCLAYSSCLAWSKMSNNIEDS